MTCRRYKTMRTRIKTIMTVLFCIYIAALAFLCFMKTDSVPDVQFTLLGIPTDKLVHFCMFAPYPILAFQTFHPDNASAWRELIILAVLAILGLGLAYSTEQIQSLTDYRSYEIADFYADSIGIAVGTAVVLVQIAFRKR